MVTRTRRALIRCYHEDGQVHHGAEASCGIEAAPHRPQPSSWDSADLTAAWLGHATVLMNLRGVTVLTDPALRTRIGIGLGPATVGPRRLVRPALTPKELPQIDLLVLSHAHMDHLDLGTLRCLPRSTTVVTHRHVGDLLSRFRQVIELDWGERTMVAGVQVEAIPARHWGARTITDTHRRYGGFILERENARVLFAGDTAYTDLYRHYRNRRVHLALMPIGAYDPWIDNHASPEQAWAMTEQLGAESVLPVHHGTFRLSREPRKEPIARFLAAAGRERGRVAVTEVGETWRAAG
jgi:L-ascorbate metabolism protein UlaG (beta-lactamase superfamily)